MDQRPFGEVWGFPGEVQATVAGAKAFLVENTDRSFKTGRAVVDVVFYDQHRREICRRDAMRLTSKKGNEYFMCRREARAPLVGAPRTRARPSAADAIGE
jgi:hypothetical protein